MAAITIESVSRVEGGRVILDDVSLDISDGELLGVMGPSGSGKTSVLRAVAGLDPVSSGRILMDGIDITDLPTRDRDVAMVFQTNTLLETRTARGNISFPLLVRRRPGPEIRDRVQAEGRALEIEEILDRWPHEISEGHAQLVQIARALVRPPRVFLLDEPLARLDPPTRTRMRRELRTIQSGYGATMIYATNDPEEAFSMADRVAVIDHGRVMQVDAPRMLWLDPVNLRVAELAGTVSLIPVQVTSDSDGFWLVNPTMMLRAWAPGLAAFDGSAVTLGVRPESVRIDAGGPISATVGTTAFGGPSVTTTIHIGDATVATAIAESVDKGSRIRVAFDRFHVFDPNGATLCTVG